MVVREIIEIDGKKFVKFHSDRNLYINKIGTKELYVEAIDDLKSRFRYREIGKRIEKSE